MKRLITFIAAIFIFLGFAFFKVTPNKLPSQRSPQLAFCNL